MPPKRKPQLSEAQIEILSWWVRIGAPQQAELKDRLLPEPVQQALAAAPAADDAAESTTESAPATQENAEPILAMDPSTIDYARELEPLLKRYSASTKIKILVGFFQISTKVRLNSTPWGV